MQRVVVGFCLLALSMSSVVFAAANIVFKGVDISPNMTDTAYSACLQQRLASHIGIPLDNSDLQLLRQNINTECFYQQGFSNSGIIYPDQSFTNDRLLVEVIEGQVGALHISGQQAVSQSWYQAQLHDALQKPFQIDALRESLLLLERQPLIANVDAQLTPGVELGQGSLTLKITEHSPYQFSFDINNIQRSPSVGHVFFNLGTRIK